MSTTFPDGKIPERSALATCGGSNRSPALSWSGASSGTKSYVVAMRSLDAPVPGVLWHWLLFNIPASVTQLAEGADPSSLPGGATDGTNDFGRRQYDGPCPRVGDAPNHYRLIVVAVDVPQLPGVGPNTTGAALTLLLHGHVLGFGRIERHYAP
ncbi:MAG TPA: YbhB/YbcL family Raf kinase inhibitor-like protein [Candidatus Baltobacteraceae bacterium]|nr:YbhB/YbcL family Raf kinase inhibitor-like protein [Candidatus Baltobacteraceae bacterium]